MISWMQHNNKYLVITIWIATIAFIGAGFVGWGSVNFGVKSSSIAEVGDIPISKVKYSFAYENLYSQYAQKFGKANFDRKKAKSLGLEKINFKNLLNEALLLNLAKEYGVVVSDKEVAQEIEKFDFLKDKNGKINKAIYENFLRARGLKAKDFEAILKDELTVQKLTKLLYVKPVALEREAMESTFNIADKIKYKLLKNKDVNVTYTDTQLKEYWKKNRANYLTNRKYSVEILWSDSKEGNFTDAQLKRFYNENSFNYSGADGKIKSFEEAKELVKRDLKLKKLKKQATLDRSRFKKGKISPSETVVVDENSKKFPPKIWKELKVAQEGDFLKPKAVESKYATIHLKKVISPKEMNFEEAKALVAKDYVALKQKEEIGKLTQNLLKDPKGLNTEPKEYITLSKFQILQGLTPQDSMLLTRYIFGSSKKVDRVDVNEGTIVYEVVDQKMLENNATSKSLNKEISSVKNAEFSSNLMKELLKRYSVKVYAKGLL